MQPVRMIHDGPETGPANMARDEALLRGVGRGASAPTLRLYQWSRPTISLGYFQRYADYEAIPPPAGTLPVVRRLTGGGAILHDLELTYSLALPADHPMLAHGANRLYELLHDTVKACLERLGLATHRCGTTDDSTPTRGPFFCFERRHRYDLLLGQEKIAGSAQRRTREALLQHGSIILANRFPQQHTAQPRSPGLQPTSNFSLDSVNQAIGQIREHFATEFRRVTGVSWELGHWLAEERREAKTLQTKYAGEEWTRRR